MCIHIVFLFAYVCTYIYCRTDLKVRREFAEFYSLNPSVALRYLFLVVRLPLSALTHWTILVSSNVYHKMVYIGAGERIQWVRALNSWALGFELEFLAPVERAGVAVCLFNLPLLWVSETGGPQRFLTVILDGSKFREKVVIRKWRQRAAESTGHCPLTFACMCTCPTCTCSHTYTAYTQHMCALCLYVILHMVFYIWFHSLTTFCVFLSHITNTYLHGAPLCTDVNNDARHISCVFRFQGFNFPEANTSKGTEVRSHDDTVGLLRNWQTLIPVAESFTPIQVHGATAC